MLALAKEKAPRRAAGRDGPSQTRLMTSGEPLTMSFNFPVWFSSLLLAAEAKLLGGHSGAKGYASVL